MRRKRFFSSIAFVLSLVMLAVSGAMFVHSAQQQSASTSLSVTFSGMNVDYTVRAWYQLMGTTERTPLRDPSNNNNNTNTTISFDATDPSSTKTLAVAENNGNIALSATATYVLFTYEFTNTASSGAKGMLVSLDNSSSSDNNISIKYLSSTDDYTPSTGLDSQASSVYDSSESEFDEIFITAGQHTKYFYILVSLEDPTLNGTYNKSSSPLSWSVECSDAETEPPVTLYITGTGTETAPFIVYEGSEENQKYYNNSITADEETVFVSKGSTIILTYGQGDNIYNYGSSNFISGAPQKPDFTPRAISIVSVSGAFSHNGANSVGYACSFIATESSYQISFYITNN